MDRGCRTTERGWIEEEGIQEREKGMEEKKWGNGRKTEGRKKKKWEET